jgi:hypothetical protein
LVAPLMTFLFGLAIWFLVVARIFECTHKWWVPDVRWKVQVRWHNSHNHQNISDKTKSCTKLYSFHDRTIHVRGGIYRALVFVFYIKWLFYPWLKHLQPFFYVRVK